MTDTNDADNGMAGIFGLAKNIADKIINENQLGEGGIENLDMNKLMETITETVNNSSQVVEEKDDDEYDRHGRSSLSEQEELEQYLSTISCPTKLTYNNTKKSRKDSSSFCSMLRDIERSVTASDPRKPKHQRTPNLLPEKGSRNTSKYATGCTHVLPFSSVCAQTVYGNGLVAMDHRLGPEHFIRLLEEQG